MTATVTVKVERDVVKYGSDVRECWTIHCGPDDVSADVRLLPETGSKARMTESDVAIGDVPEDVVNEARSALKLARERTA